MLSHITINEHSSIRIDEDKVIYFDPYRIITEPHDADLVFITHAHYDHFSPEDIVKVQKEGTLFVMPQSMKGEEAKLAVSPEQLVWLCPNENTIISGYEVQTIPSYNTNKPMHPRENGWLGYVVKIGEKTLYVAGDTDVTKEAKAVVCDIALLPIGATYTMNASEAAELTNFMKPSVVIPTHYGTLVGKPEDADEFQSLVHPDVSVCRKM